MTRLLAFLATCAFLANCSGLTALTDASKSTEVYLLTPKSTFAKNLPKVRQQVVVEAPTATAAVDTDQIAVMPTPLRVQYLPRARWVDRAPLIVQELLIESYENTNKVAAVGRSEVGLRSDYLIVADLREFQAQVPKEPESEAALVVNVRLNIKIVYSEEDRIIGSRSFNEFMPAISDETDDVAVAFDEALGDVLRDSVEWSVREIHKHAIRTEAERERLQDALDA